ncbi:hypothetical protein Z517_04320 [Fonsecaea pedrosoi CBS 271.37]|uniref:Protein kinase domain-containing protein n=1 Tax=Fonsecaea pedrosoi CBS 271.37 TaxID=1442368 RepID=A0A0D2GRV5_9EURO|nr:uncharacterized protein Z517_04320 [Fonsecaea pedrosoi CBS 271.37]KIW81295.1 hypothetical protein Z517_04320 [Fonsecaea pedrosoi CBS 271.37]
MADFATTYQETETLSTPSDRRQDIAVVDGPASFLALAVEMGVPIISRAKPGAGGTLSIGGGLSFAVARAHTTIKLAKGTDWANETPADWFDRVQSKSNGPEIIVVKNHVNKRILVPRQSTWQDRYEHDADIFFAVTNELRILAHEAVRKSLNIVSLIAISWNTRETKGRFLPEILLEGAQHGSVDQYLQVSPNLDFCSRALMVMDISTGLAFLHDTGIVHCDVKPGNMLVCDSPQRKDLKSMGMAPVIVKLCDFGCSIILSDYPKKHRFSIGVGTPRWMAPEIEQGLPVEAELLFKTDIYSLGLVAAHILKGTQPYSDIPATHEVRKEDSSVLGRSLNDNDPLLLSRPGDNDLVSVGKRKHGNTDEDEGPCDRKRKSVEKPATATEYSARIGQHFECSHEAHHSSTLLASVLDTSRNEVPSDGHSELLRQILSRTVQAIPSDRSDAREIGQLCRAALLHVCTSPDTDFFRSMLPSFPEERTDTPVASDLLNKARVPNLAFETSLRSGLLPRQCLMEIVKDLKRRVEYRTRDAGQCALQLAALVLNGHLICEHDQVQDEAEKYLSFAVSSGDQLALLGAINVLQAMGREVTHDTRRRVLNGFQDHAFQLQAMSDIKSLFFPLSFNPTTRMTAAAQFPFDEKFNIQAKLIGLRTWKREFPHDFAAFTRSQTFRQLLAVIPITRLISHEVDWPLPGDPRLSESILAEYIYNSHVHLDTMSQNEREVFVDICLGNDMVNEPTALGMTLLQLATLREDIEMASLLLEILGADIEACGLTPGCTPLWLACYLGFIDMAVFLISRGADVTCTDSVQGLTILHLLTQFETKDAVEGIGCQALAVGVDVNAESDTGITPLLAAMLAFDFSSGAAIEFLLQNGANPLTVMATKLEGFDFPVTPLSLCVVNLDFDLLEHMISVIPSEDRDCHNGYKVASREELGFQLMRSQTTFAAMFETGRKFRDNLARILKKIVYAERSNLLWMAPVVEPVVYAFQIDRSDLMESLLTIDPKVPLEMPVQHGQHHPPIPLLHEAVLRHNYRAVDVLIRYGADLLQRVGIGATVLTWLTREIPDMLPVALKHLESLPAAKRDGKTVKEILQMPQFDLSGTFDTLLVAGTSEDIRIAETLRVKYSLHHDNTQVLPPNTSTLVGSLLVWTSYSGYDRLAQIRYLLSLKPKPRLMMPCGVNLFMIASSVSDGSKAVEQLELFRLLLDTYPEMENLTQGHRGKLPVLHRVASGANLEILRLMEEHVVIKHPGKRFPYNYTHLRNEIQEGAVLLTMLDCSRFANTIPEFGASMHESSTRHEDVLAMSTFDRSVRQDEREKVYRHLRDHGAVHGWELDGYFISGRILWKNSTTRDKLHGFLDRVTTRYSMAPWEHGPEHGEFPSTWYPFAWRQVQKESNKGCGSELLSTIRVPPEIFGAKAALTICELVWRGNSFYIQAWDLPFEAEFLQESVSYYFSTRLHERGRWATNLEGLGDTPPYQATTYCEITERGTKSKIPYTRTGRTWTDEEVSKLSHDVFSEWAQELGELEEFIPDLLRAVVMSYF